MEKATGVKVSHSKEKNAWGTTLQTFLVVWDPSDAFFEVRYTRDGGKTWRNGYWNNYGAFQPAHLDTSYAYRCYSERDMDVGFQIRQKDVSAPWPEEIHYTHSVIDLGIDDSISLV